jgi:hypothetical protein
MLGREGGLEVKRGRGFASDKISFHCISTHYHFTSLHITSCHSVPSPSCYHAHPTIQTAITSTTTVYLTVHHTLRGSQSKIRVRAQRTPLSLPSMPTALNPDCAHTYSHSVLPTHNRTEEVSIALQEQSFQSPPSHPQKHIKQRN